jgi:hypothetical protein
MYQNTGGGGGSGFVYGYINTTGDLSNHPIPAAYTGYIFTDDMSCVAGNATKPAKPVPSPDDGHGQARITYTP